MFIFSLLRIYSVDYSSLAKLYTLYGRQSISEILHLIISNSNKNILVVEIIYVKEKKVILSWLICFQKKKD